MVRSLRVVEASSRAREQTLSCFTSIVPYSGWVILRPVLAPFCGGDVSWLKMSCCLFLDLWIRTCAVADHRCGSSTFWEKLIWYNRVSCFLSLRASRLLLSFFATTIVDPPLVLNFRTPWRVDGAAYSWNSTGRPSRILWSVGRSTNKNSSVLVICLVPSWLINVNGSMIIHVG